MMTMPKRFSTNKICVEIFTYIWREVKSIYSLMSKKYQLQFFTKMSYHESLYSNFLIYQKSEKNRPISILKKLGVAMHFFLLIAHVFDSRGSHQVTLFTHF